MSKKRARRGSLRFFKVECQEVHATQKFSKDKQKTLRAWQCHQLEATRPVPTAPELDPCSLESEIILRYQLLIPVNEHLKSQPATALNIVICSIPKEAKIKFAMVYSIPTKLKKKPERQLT